MDEKEIAHLRNVYNKEHPDEIAIPEGTTKKVWSEITKRLHKRCETKSAQCIANAMMSQPTAPTSWETNPEEWLSSIDIDKVEKEYTKVFPIYHHMGCIPIDFDKKSSTGTCLVDSLCSIKLTDLYSKGYRQIGIVFNTDVSTGPGQHWIALFCDIRPELEYPRITYFDSYAHKPEKEIQRLMKRWKEQWDSTKIHSKKMVLSYNKTRHQYEDSECGMYCLYFHYCCLTGLPMNERVPDEVVRGFRGVLFRVGKK
jgi:hypothetical protein